MHPSVTLENRYITAWQRGVVVTLWSRLKVALHRARLLLGWVTISADR